MGTRRRQTTSAGTTAPSPAVGLGMTDKQTSPCDGMPQESAGDRPGVTVPVLPFNAYSPLYVTHPNQRAGLVVAMGNMRKFRAACSITIHGQRCTYGVHLWPRVISSEHADHARAVRKQRDAECTCIPLVMYSGASA